MPMESMLLYPTLLYHVACHVITNESVNFAVETVTWVVPEGTLLA